MAELASGAVGTLLGVIGQEALRLGRVRHDVQFIQEEMESMGSFLANLSRNSREHDEQVRTWMNQVRMLANDCNNCIDLYLYRGDPALHLPKDGPGRYLRWAPWRLSKLLAQHRAADQLRELKDRAQDIGNRRMRYGVEVKTESSPSGAGLTEALLLPASQDHEEEDADKDQDGVGSLQVALSMTSMRMDKEEGFRRRLDEWIRSKIQAGEWEVGLLPSIAFVVTETNDANALVHVALATAEDHYFKLPPENKDIGALTREGKAVPANILTHEDKAVPPENKHADPLVHEDREDVPPETKDGGDLHTKIRQCHRRPMTATLLGMKIRRLCHRKTRMRALLCVKIRRLCHRRPRTPVRSETKDIGTRAHKDKHVPPETKDVDDALVHEDKIVPPETKDNSALVHEDKAVVAPKTKDVDALAHEDEVVVPTDAKDTAGGAFALHDKAAVPLKTKDTGTLVHEDKVVASPEAKDAGAFSHEDKGVASPETKNTGALVHEDKDVSSETKVVDTLAHKDKVVVSPETKSATALDNEEKVVVILVDIPEVHYSFETLRPHKILCYILAELKRQQDTKPPRTRWGTYKYTKKQIREIKGNIKHVGKKIRAIKIRKEDGKKLLENLQKSDSDIDKLEGRIDGEQLGQLLSLLLYYSTTVTSEKDKKNKAMVEEMYDAIIKKTSKDLKGEIEAGGSSSKMQESEYKEILQEVFPRSPSSSNTSAIATSSPDTLVADGIKDIVTEFKEMMNELRGVDKSDKNQETSTEAAQMTPEADSAEVTEKKREIKKKTRQQLKNKMMVQKIKECLGDDGRRRILVILKVDDKYVRQWEETRKSLSLMGRLECPIAGAVIVAKTTREDNKQYFRSSVPQPIEYSLVGVYFDTVLQKTSNHMDDAEIHKILRNILCKCESYEFCMKIFAHALYAKPKRSSEELSKLDNTLPAGATQKSLLSVMLKFSYRDLPKQYRSCLLYLAIFPQGHTIRRSTLIGRWVAEGLITTKDWRWSSSVDEAETCFDTLVARCLVCPVGIGATGKVKSCTVDKLVYGFITKIAMKQRILETRLSHHLAHHFSIFSDVRLRRSENIGDFLKNPSQFSKLKVLDLEGCHCFQQKNQHYLRDICKKMLMLKYLSLRRTDVTKLPREINKLHELEVLDIRETKIPASATRHVLLQKLKRLLAGHVDSSLVDFSSVPSFPEKIEKSNVKPQNRLKCLLVGDVDSSTSSGAHFSSVQIPEKIEKMLGVEILSNVKVKKKQDLRDIAGLNELKKLGVVINKESHLQELAKAISDLLNQSLRFLSVTLDITRHKGTPSNLTLKENVPNVLESLSINGTTITHEGKLLPLLTTNAKQLAKVTLTDTSLSQEDLQILAKLENLRCVKLRPNNIESKLTFNKDEFKNLKKILVEGTSLSEIKFENGAASNLEKIVFSSTNEVSISGVDCLQKLEELELNNITNKAMLHSLLVNAKHITKVTLRNTLLEQGDLEILARERKMHYLALSGKFCDGNQLIFKECDFHKLNVLIVDSDDITEISFSDGSPNLEKIVWSFKNIVSLSGIKKLPALKELELNGDSVPNKVKEDIEILKSRLDYKHMEKPKKQEKKTEPDGAAKCPSLWKAKNWCWRN